MGAGFLFKPYPLALLIVLLGDVFASVWAFFFGRYVFYDWVKDTMSKHPKFGALDEVIKEEGTDSHLPLILTLFMQSNASRHCADHQWMLSMNALGWKIVVMLRLTPIPFNLITYFFSVTSIRLWTVVWATCIGVLPGSCIGIWIGSLLKGLSGIDHPDLETKNLVVIAMNFVFVACCILTLSIFGKRSLRNALKRLEQHQALSSVPEVEVVVEGVATVIHELEDAADVPPSLRSTTIERLAAEDDLNDDRSNQRPSQSRGRDEEEASSLHNKAHPPRPLDKPSSSGFTRGERITFVGIALLATLNVCVCVPLYYHFANQQ